MLNSSKKIWRMRMSEEFERTEFTNNIIGNKDGDGDKFVMDNPRTG